MVEPIYSERFNPIYQALDKNQQKIQNVNLFKISESSNLQKLLIKSIKGESEASSFSVLLKQDFLQFCCCFETLFYLNFPILSLPFYLLIRLKPYLIICPVIYRLIKCSYLQFRVFRIKKF